MGGREPPVLQLVRPAVAEGSERLPSVRPADGTAGDRRTLTMRVGQLTGVRRRAAAVSLCLLLASPLALAACGGGTSNSTDTSGAPAFTVPTGDVASAGASAGGATGQTTSTSSSSTSSSTGTTANTTTRRAARPATTASDRQPRPAARPPPRPSPAAAPLPRRAPGPPPAAAPIWGRRSVSRTQGRVDACPFASLALTARTARLGAVAARATRSGIRQHFASPDLRGSVAPGIASPHLARTAARECHRD